MENVDYKKKVWISKPICINICLSLSFLVLVKSIHAFNVTDSSSVGSALIVCRILVQEVGAP